MWRSWQLPATVLLLLLAAAPGPGCSGSLLSKEGGEANGTFTFDTSKLNSTNEVTAETISGATALATGAASVDHAVRSTTPEDNGTPSMQAGASKGVAGADNSSQLANPQVFLNPSNELHIDTTAPDAAAGLAQPILSSSEANMTAIVVIDNIATGGHILGFGGVEGISVANTGSGCQVVIERKDPNQSGAIINLAELRLFDQSGVQIPNSQLSIWMSDPHSTYGPQLCLDGDVNTFCHSNDNDYALDPRLIVGYPCSRHVSKVEVENRRQCCRDRITAFRMRFLDPRGADMAAAYQFTTQGPTYTITSGCQVVIERKDPNQSGAIINLAELRLFDQSGMIPNSELRIGMSSTHPTYGSQLCLDGDVNTFCHSRSDPLSPDLDPRLIVTYPCARRVVKVEVENRRDCCTGRITAFRMRFWDELNSDMAAQYPFTTSAPTYTITPDLSVTCPPPSCPSQVRAVGVCVSSPGEECFKDGMVVTCRPCPKGFFNTGGNTTTLFPPCSGCDAGWTTTSTCSTVRAACNVVVCQPGQGGTECAQCPRGTYSTGGSREDPSPNCVSCPASKTTAGPGATNATSCNVDICPAGTAGPGCRPAPVGSYSLGGTPTVPEGVAVKCPDGTTTSREGAYMVALCINVTGAVVDSKQAMSTKDAAVLLLIPGGAFLYTLLASAATASSAISSLAPAGAPCVAPVAGALSGVDCMAFPNMLAGLVRQLDPGAIDALRAIRNVGVGASEAIVDDNGVAGFIEYSELMARLPRGAVNEWVAAPARFPDGGFKYVFTDELANSWTVWGHGPDLELANAAETNAGRMWTVRVEMQAAKMGTGRGNIRSFLRMDGGWLDKFSATALRPGELFMTHVPLMMPLL